MMRQQMNDFEAWQRIIEEWKQVDKMKRLNQRLYGELGGAIMFILEYSKRNNIVLPNKDRLFRLVDNIHVTTDAIKEYHEKISSPTESQQRNKTTEDSTEPYSLSSILRTTFILSASFLRPSIGVS